MSCRIVADGVSKTYQLAPRTARLVQALRGALEPARIVHALRDVSFAIGDGERVGLIGRNGAGKSTLLHLIAGLASPSAGKLDIVGRVHPLLTLGTVLREESTGRENIYVDGEIQGKSGAEIDAQIDRIVEFADLGEFIDMPVRTYSSGMKARLSFSMAAFIEPEILIIDEVLSAGDVHFAAKATRRMRDLTATGRIVLIVSHGLESIVDMCTRCIWLDQGRIVMDGDPEAVTRAYAEAVEAADEAELRRKFAQGAPLPEGVTGARLAAVAIVQDERGADRTVLTAGHPAVFRASGDAGALRAPDLRLRLTRIDGSLVTEAFLSDGGDVSALGGPFRAEIAMRPLVLGAAAYRAEFALCEGGKVVSALTKVFEVKPAAPLIGGSPLLLYPSSLIVKRVAACVS